MLRIGICEDNEKDRDVLHGFCECFFESNMVSHEYIFFSAGEEVLRYCQKETNPKIDLLFLDVELSGISGMEVKDKVIKQNQVWRIVFVSRHKQSVFEAFALKTLGFMIKPSNQEKVAKWIQLIIDEIEENREIEITGIGGNSSSKTIKLEDIGYFKAAGNYTEVFVYDNVGQEKSILLSTKKIGELEKDMKGTPIIRVHKSYMVNLSNVTEIDQNITLRNIDIHIPIGRMYNKMTRKSYMEYGKDKIQKRI